MGRIKTTFVKRIGRELFEADPDGFSDDFTKNKQIVRERSDIASRKLLNTVTGYVTTLRKINKE